MDEVSLISEMTAVADVNKEEVDLINRLAEKLDFIDIQLLRKFYATGKAFPDDCQPYCFPMLYNELRSSRQIKVGLEAVRKRLDNMVRVGLLQKVKNSNPTNYYPVRDKETFFRAVIMRFFLINGLTKFL